MSETIHRNCSAINEGQVFKLENKYFYSQVLKNFVRLSVLVFIFLHHIVSRKVVLATVGGIFHFPAFIAYCHRERKRTF